MKNLFTKEFGEKGKGKDGRSFFLPVKMKNNAIVSITSGDGGIYCKVKDVSLPKVSKNESAEEENIALSISINPYVPGKEKNDAYLLELADIYAEQIMGGENDYSDPFWRMSGINALNLAILYLMETEGVVNKQTLLSYFELFSKGLNPEQNMTDTEYYKMISNHIAFNADSLCKKHYDVAFMQTVKTTKLVLNEVLLKLGSIAE